MKLSDRKINLQRREEGGWVGNIPECGDLELKVRGSGNRDWARMEQKLIAAVPRQRRVNGLEPEDRLRINSILVRECSLLDWRGVENGTGELLPYSKEAAKQYLDDPQYEAFVWACVWAAGVVAEEGQAEIEDDAKKLIAALRWQHQWGGQIQHWEFMAERGRAAPDGYYDRPEIEPHLTWLWNAFWELGTERQIGMAVGRIPISKIREYLRDELEIDSSDYDRARTIIRKMDDAYLGMLNRSKADGPVVSDAAKLTDTEGVKRVMRGLDKRRAK